MDRVIIIQFVILIVVVFAIYKTGYFKGATDERRKDIRSRQEIDDARSDFVKGFASCREADELHREVERVRGKADS